MDDPAYQKPVMYDSIAQQLNDWDVIISNPKLWTYANQDMIENYDAVNPNDPNRIAIRWNGSEIKHLLEVIIKEYKASLKNWTKGTGGGPGAPEN